MTNRTGFGPTKPPYSRGQAAQFWRKQCRRWEKSGLVQAEFCRRHRISLAALRWWRGEINRRDRTRSKSGRPAFLPVRVVPASTTPAAGVLEVEVRGGRVLRVRQDFDPLLLRKVVAALENDPC